MKIFLGIDGGGTNTRAILVDSAGSILGQATAGPSNYHNIGLENTAMNLSAVTAAAWQNAGLPMHPADAAFLGCAGIKSATDIARMTTVAETIGLATTGEVTVANDLYNALAGGLAGNPGIAVIAGTGTNSLGCNAKGNYFMCGGWGWLLDDVGGGFGLTLAAMRAAARSADRRAPQTQLLPALLAFLGLSEPNELLARLYVDKWTTDELAAFAPVIMRTASAGDAVAKDILQAGAAALAELVLGCQQALKFQSGPDVVLLGGCASSGEPYQPMIEAAISAVCPQARIVPAALSPAHGAAINALRCGGVSPLPTLIESNK